MNPKVFRQPPDFRQKTLSSPGQGWYPGGP